MVKETKGECGGIGSGRKSKRESRSRSGKRNSRGSGSGSGSGKRNNRGSVAEAKVVKKTAGAAGGEVVK